MADVTIKMPQSPPYPDGQSPQGTDLVWVWDKNAGVLRQSPISGLTFSSDGGGSGAGSSSAVLPAAFHVRIDSAAYFFDGTNTVISDARLIGATDYPVSTTQGGLGEFNDDQLEYDSVDGKVTILNFQLDDGEKITITAPGITDTSVSTSLASILDRLTALEAIAAVFTPSALGAKGGMVLWKRPASEIPPGWQEVTDWRGRLPVGYDPDDADFNAIGTKTGGAKTHALTIDEMPAHGHTFEYTAPAAGSDFGSGSTRPSTTSYKTDSGTTDDTGGNSAFNIMNPYRTVMFIEYIGV